VADRSVVLDQNTYKRAVGEVVMIVLGVLIALAASDWQQARSERRTELDVLGELRTALIQDLRDLDAQVLRYERIDRRVSALLEIIDSGAPYADSLDSYFGTLYGVEFPRLNRAGYESLKSRGLDLARTMPCVPRSPGCTSNRTLVSTMCSIRSGW